MNFFELYRERYWFPPDPPSAGSPFVIHLFMIGQSRHSIVNVSVPQKPRLGVVDEVAATGNVDMFSYVGSGRPTRFVGSLPSPQSIT